MSCGGLLAAAEPLQRDNEELHVDRGSLLTGHCNHVESICSTVIEAGEHLI